MLIVLVNLGHFGIEFGVAPALGSVSLFADSIDFREDAAVNGLILVALGWSTHRRSIVGMILALILLVPAWQRRKPREKSSITGPAWAVPFFTDRLGSTLINLFRALLPARYRAHREV